MRETEVIASMANATGPRAKFWHGYRLSKLGANLRSVAQGCTMPFFRRFA